jgi:serine/threonine protein phosphatase PrpC
MGGHSAGDVASDAVVRRIEEAAVRDRLTTDDLEEALRLATADIAVAAADTELGVGTTATGAFLSDDEGEPEFTIFNVGDSRVYLADAGVLQQVTVDHSVVQEMVDAGLLRAEDAENHPDSNVITRAVGFDVAQRPDYWRVPARAGLRLLVCSDGLTKELSAADIERVLAAEPESLGAATAHVRASTAAGTTSPRSSSTSGVQRATRPGTDPGRRPQGDRRAASPEVGASSPSPGRAERGTTVEAPSYDDGGRQRVGASSRALSGERRGG